MLGFRVDRIFGVGVSNSFHYQRRGSQTGPSTGSHEFCFKRRGCAGVGFIEAWRQVALSKLADDAHGSSVAPKTLNPINPINPKPQTPYLRNTTPCLRQTLFLKAPVLSKQGGLQCSFMGGEGFRV